MKTTFRMTFVVLALGMLVGNMARTAAQEPVSGAISGQDSAATTHIAVTPDNGALPGDSHVRIVRLSDVKGMLALDRKTGKGFEQTMQNMPIVEGNRLQTADGYAEVEFEDNSTLRLAPNTLVDFPLLALRNTGAKASTMKVVHGTVYVSTESTKGNEFELEAGGSKMFVAASTHLRLEVDGANSVMSVFNGNVEVQRGANSTVVGKKETLTLDATQMDVAKKVAEEPFDAWDKESIDYHQRYATANTFAGGGNAFGLSDLNYYGSFINAGGCGQMWQPYLVSAAWSPSSNGLWALYPGAGYSWVSPYPWGWLPYHTGSWGFCQGVGWGWQPGGAWNGLNNIATTMNGTMPSSTLAKGVVHSPLRAAALPQMPVAGAGSSLVLANDKPLVFSKEDKPGNFVFQRDSAGLGVPRGSLGNLNKISTDAMRHGSVNMPVYATGPGGVDGSRASRGPSTLRSGTPGEFSAEHGNMSASSMSRQGSSGPSGASASRGGGGMSSAGGAAMGGGAAGGAGGNSSGASHGAAASPK
jgi:hypothetical protein